MTGKRLWCLKENREARKFYEKMGGEVYKTCTHPWGNRDYEIISYLYRLDGLETPGTRQARR